MQFQLLSLLALQGGSTPPLARCTAADQGKICQAGAINGFYVTGECSQFPIFNDDGEQYACIPLGTLLGGTPTPNNK